jgi:uncharacterized membrane protein YozB (DUF420 family)
MADLPWINATLNATSAVLLLIGLVLIRRGNWRWHAAFMILAVTTSAAFLVSYITYHMHAGIRRFPIYTQPTRAAYFTVLLSHTFLAAVIVPLVLATLSLAIGRRWRTHRRFGRPTLWIWLYVSVTGVVIYWMLYRLPHAL